MTLEQLIRRVTERLKRSNIFYGHGTDNPADEACYLVASVIGFDAIYINPDTGLEVEPRQQESIEQLVKLRIDTRKPAAYLVNKAWFAGLEFYVDERVLVPRSPIAELIEDRFQPWIDVNMTRRVLDIGTGSGCIAIACASYLEEVTVDAVDIDPDALQVARKNIAAHGLEHRVRPVQADLFPGDPQQQYDVIIANPPYVSIEEIRQLPDEYHHEPVSALEADDQGL
ncbi:MAG: 50S ribosomal protein L3 N(5)-glutamine methyltransferase, partial [Gammaproteobacteria bacterium]|nr:50S ribosomal protein L3 N(5)-glutamine methyltransferase [Gammaproteobacteria bacterium]